MLRSVSCFSLRFSAALAGLLAAFLVLAAIPARAQEAEVPYWVSLRNDETNLRVGPGREYRISWVYVRKGLPMKVVRVMGGWRLVEEPDGTRGWILARFLSRTRTALVKGGVAEMREGKDGSGRTLWRVESGVVGRLGDCEDEWCRFDVDGRAGYVRQDVLWGAGAP